MRITPATGHSHSALITRPTLPASFIPYDNVFDDVVPQGDLVEGNAVCCTTSYTPPAPLPPSMITVLIAHFPLSGKASFAVRAVFSMASLRLVAVVCPSKTRELKSKPCRCPERPWACFQEYDEMLDQAGTSPSLQSRVITSILPAGLPSRGRDRHFVASSACTIYSTHSAVFAKLPRSCGLHATIRSQPLPSVAISGVAAVTNIHDEWTKTCLLDCSEALAFFTILGSEPQGDRRGGHYRSACAGCSRSPVRLLRLTLRPPTNAAVDHQAALYYRDQLA
ncbi:hypothetical protein C8R45DRAFT_947293 [Mycena sanguinolenta]|nr:hypothetical protein C8R45DRAFT_947293 [Mycena sanguinolenta]